MNPLNAQDVLLRPLKESNQPRSNEEEALFIPTGADRMWFFGTVEPWSNFHEQAIQFVKSQLFKSAFDEIKGHPIKPPRTSTPDITYNSNGLDRLTDYFQREVLEVVDVICNKLLQTLTLRQGDVPERVYLGKASDEDIGNADSKWDPKYVVRATPIDGDNETRLIGHVEYMAGRPGALTAAIKDAAKNTWESLRCVLGDITQWMLIDHITYAFLTTSDEIMFLRIEVVTKVENVNLARKDEEPDVEQVDVLKEPLLYYSKPVKHTDVLNEEEGTIPVRLALLYMLHKSNMLGWQLDEDLGPCLNFAEKVKAGEKWKPKPFDFMVSGLFG